MPLEWRQMHNDTAESCTQVKGADRRDQAIDVMFNNSKIVY